MLRNKDQYVWGEDLSWAIAQHTHTHTPTHSGTNVENLMLEWKSWREIQTLYFIFSFRSSLIIFYCFTHKSVASHIWHSRHCNITCWGNTPPVYHYSSSPSLFYFGLIFITMVAFWSFSSLILFSIWAFWTPVLSFSFSSLLPITLWDFYLNISVPNINLSKRGARQHWWQICTI